MEGYFTAVMNSVHTGMMIAGTPAYIFGDTVFDMRDIYYGDPVSFESDKYAEGMQATLFAGFMLPLFKNVAFPVFGGFNVVDSNSPDHLFSKASYIAGGGLAAHGRFGVLAGYSAVLPV